MNNTPRPDPAFWVSTLPEDELRHVMHLLVECLATDYDSAVDQQQDARGILHSAGCPLGELMPEYRENEGDEFGEPIP